MNKIIALLLILIIAPILGGIYGLIHDQITYSISEEYYTKFKFVQFGLANWGLGENIGTARLPEIKLDNPRYGAAIIGVLATWWVGLIIGILLGLIGLIHKNGKRLFQITMSAFFLVFIIAFLTGVVGLVLGKIMVANSTSDWSVPKHVMEVERFIIVGSIHNFSYLGGLIGLIIGMLYTIRQRA